MKRLLAFLFLSLAACQLKAQNNSTVDSLLKALDIATEDSTKMDLQRQIGLYYSDNNAGKAIGYLEGSLELAKKLGRKLLIANNYYSIGFCYLLKGDYEHSLNNYLQSVRVYEEMKDSMRLSNAYISIGNLYTQNKKYNKTTEYYEKARLLIEAKNDSSHLATLFGQYGTFFDEQKKFDSALFYSQRSASICRLIKDDYGVIVAYSNMGLTYKHMGNTERALRCFDSVLTVFINTNAAKDDFATVYNNIGATYSQAGDYTRAAVAFSKSISLSKEAGSAGIEMENYHNLSDMYGTMKNYEQQAVYLKKYYGIKDSLFNADSKNQLTQLEADFQVEKKNTEIVKKDAELIRGRNQRNIFITITIAAVLLLSVTAFFYRRIKKTNELLQEKNSQINKQKDELLTLNQVKDRLFSIISHDLRNPLVTLNTYLAMSDNPSLPEEKKQQFRTQTIQAVSQTSDMLDNLLVWANMQIKNSPVSIVPVSIADCVLDSIANVKAQATQKQIHIRQQLEIVTVPGDYNILVIALRNLLTNAVKFSPADTGILVSAVKKNNHLLLTVKDEGAGMTAAQLAAIRDGQAESTRGTQGEKGTGLGVFLVKELLQKINGRLLVESELNKGSSFTIELPSM